MTIPQTTLSYCDKIHFNIIWLLWSYETKISINKLMLLVHFIDDINNSLLLFILLKLTGCRSYERLLTSAWQHSTSRSHAVSLWLSSQSAGSGIAPCWESPSSHWGQHRLFSRISDVVKRRIATPSNEHTKRCDNWMTNVCRLATNTPRDVTIG